MIGIYWNSMNLFYNWWESIRIAFVQFLLERYSLSHIWAQLGIVCTTGNFWVHVGVCKSWALKNTTGLTKSGRCWGSRLRLISDRVLGWLIFYISKHQGLSSLGVLIMWDGHRLGTRSILIWSFSLLIHKVLVLCKLNHFHQSWTSSFQSSRDWVALANSLKIAISSHLWGHKWPFLNCVNLVWI